MRKYSSKVYNHSATPHDKIALERIKLIKQGQNFRDLPKNLQTKSVHSGAWGRLEANGLAPTITTRFDTPSVGRVIHPYQDRTLTVRELREYNHFLIILFFMEIEHRKVFRLEIQFHHL